MHWLLPEQVLWGDFGEMPIEALAGLSQAVILPLLNNPAVRATWPETVAQDLTAHLHKFLSAGPSSACWYCSADIWTAALAFVNWFQIESHLAQGALSIELTVKKGCTNW